MPRIYEPVGPTENKAAGPTEAKKPPAQETKTAAKSAGKKDNGGGNK